MIPLSKKDPVLLPKRGPSITKGNLYKSVFRIII